MSAFGLRITTSSQSDALTLDEVKLFLRQDNDADDLLISDLIGAAQMRFERVTDRQLLTATCLLTLPGFPACSLYFEPRYGWGTPVGTWRAPPDPFPNGIRLPRPPLVSVTAIQYIDTGGVLQTLASSVYRVATSREPGIVTPDVGQIWPYNVAVFPEAVQITYVAGYGAYVPYDIKQALKRCVLHEYEEREKADESYLDRLFMPFGYGGYW